MGFFGRLFGSSGETNDQREERLYREQLEQNSTTVNADFSDSARFEIQDVFSIFGRGTVVNGMVTEGSFSVGDTVRIEKPSGERIQTVISAVEMFRMQCNTVSEGDNAGILLRGIPHNNITKGDLIIK